MSGAGSILTLPGRVELLEPAGGTRYDGGSPIHIVWAPSPGNDRYRVRLRALREDSDWELDREVSGTSLDLGVPVAR